MGDNRSDSYDSRFWGFAPRNTFIGVPVMIYLSVDAAERSEAKSTLTPGSRAI